MTKYKSGSRVIPIGKTIGGTPLKSSVAYKAAQKEGRNYLVVKYVESGMYNCEGDFFSEKDLIPYISNPEEDDTFCTLYRTFSLDVNSLRENWNEIIRLMSNDPEIPAIFVKWDYDDVRHVGVEMNIKDADSWPNDFCEKVLSAVRKHYDPNTGVTWEIIEYWIIESMSCGI